MEYIARKEGHIEETSFLSIDPAILKTDGVRFAPGVANRKGVPLLTLDEAIDQMDFSVVYCRTDWKDADVQKRRQAAKKYEVLVPIDVPTTLIRGL